jgi:hypothetical protein
MADHMKWQTANLEKWLYKPLRRSVIVRSLNQTDLNTFSNHQHFRLYHTDEMAIFTIASIIALAASSIAASDAVNTVSKRGLATVDFPVNSDVKAAINDWNTDVVTVNDFLNSVHDQLSDLATLASNAQNIVDNFAKDEPNQLKTLGNWFNASAQPDVPTDAFDCAFDDLATGKVIDGATFNFDTLVIKQFTDFIIPLAQAGNADGTVAQVGEVNSFRCCNVLPDLDILWRDSAISAGFSETDIPFSPARPDACASIDCSTTTGASDCKSQDNGRFA